jgi:hypothetical protein
LDIFNESSDYVHRYEIKECVKDIGENPRDWIFVKHIVYKKSNIWLYGQVVLYSATVGLKYYKYEYTADAKPLNYSDMEEFVEIQPKNLDLNQQYVNT